MISGIVIFATVLAGGEGAETTPTPPWLGWTGIPMMETVPVMESGKSAFLVTGDEARNKEMCLPGGAPVTVKVELPRNWDRLMAERVSLFPVWTLGC